MGVVGVATSPPYGPRTGLSCLLGESPLIHFVHLSFHPVTHHFHWPPVTSTGHPSLQLFTPHPVTRHFIHLTQHHRLYLDTVPAVFPVNIVSFLSLSRCPRSFFCLASPLLACLYFNLSLFSISWVLWSCVVSLFLVLLFYFFSFMEAGFFRSCSCLVV